MRKALRLVAILAAFALTVWIGVVALAQGSSAPTPSTSTTAVTSGEDVEGNCDEAEHANDPECVGVNLAAEDDDQGENDDQADVNDDDQGENEDNDDQGENEDNDDQGDVNDDDQGENEDNDDQGDNSGPGSENSDSD